MLHYDGVLITFSTLFIMFGISLHVLFVHFPIVLAIFAVYYDFRAYLADDRLLYSVGSTLIKYAAIFGVLATATGLQHAGATGLGSDSIVSAHAVTGIIGTISLIALAGRRYSLEARDEDREKACSLPWLVAEVLTAFFIAVTAIVGHQI